jgi:hypothetical protein
MTLMIKEKRNGMEQKKIIRAADYLPAPKADSEVWQDFELPASEKILYGLFGTSPDYGNQQFEELWQEILDAEDADTVAYCRARGVDVIGNDGEEVPGWRDIAVMLKAIEHGLLTLEESEETSNETH